MNSKDSELIIYYFACFLSFSMLNVGSNYKPLYIITYLPNKGYLHFHILSFSLRKEEEEEEDGAYHAFVVHYLPCVDASHGHRLRYF